MLTHSRLTVIGWIGLLVTVGLFFARRQYVADFANNADADAIRFYTAFGIGCFALISAGCLLAARRG